MKIIDSIKKFFKSLLFRKEQKSNEFTTELKTFYDIELLENAKVFADTFVEKSIPKAGEGKEVHFLPYKSLSINDKIEEGE